MPESTQKLRDKFMKDGDDGIVIACKIITDAGGSITNGLIKYAGKDSEVWDAVTFLVQEWDYDIR